jgi:hypothetical protein
LRSLGKPCEAPNFVRLTGQLVRITALTCGNVLDDRLWSTYGAQELALSVRHDHRERSGGCWVVCHELTLGNCAPASRTESIAPRVRSSSADPVGTQREFAELHDFDYPLLSDPLGTVAEQFGIRRRAPLAALRTKRITFVVDIDRRILEVIHNELSMTRHADRALEILRAHTPR